ncbi:MAG: DUF302 domain-containing protein [Ignavibacteriaceae bacterium]|nr:DUF302 domain-containing protein [Ignavibacteriaceae bacterium]
MYSTKVINCSFDEAIVKITEKLKDEGFGILSDIDVSATLKNRINVDFRKYRILGACNPPFAHKALSVEPNAGVMMPCNVAVQEISENEIQVSVVNPSAAAVGLNNPGLITIADEVTEKLDRFFNNLK